MQLWRKSDSCPLPTEYRQAIPRRAAARVRRLRNASPGMMIGSMNSSVKEKGMMMNPALMSTLEVMI
jgi:hypothetical protein